MAKTSKRQTGDLGEDIACKYLQNKGFLIVERNYLRKWGEIDIIAQKDIKGAKRLYFVEVKTARLDSARQVTREKGAENGSRGTYRPEDNVHPAKLMRLHRAIQTYLLDHRVPEDVMWQIDLACVYLDMSTRKARVEILENVIL